MPESHVTVLGAGVVGLTTAMLLSRTPDYSVTVVAKHMPGDYDIEYASPWADTVVYRRAKDVGTATGDWFAELLREDAWFADVVPN
ncbi:hypothetical protein B0A49_09405, partial [Cryomyces minteri]